MKVFLLFFAAVSISAQGLQFYPIAPCRLVDTRGAGAGFVGVAPFSGPSIPAMGTITIPVLATNQTTAPTPCVIPSTAQAYALNLTVVPPSSADRVDYVTLWPSGQPQPTVATLDDPQGAIVSNGAIAGAGTPSGGISVYNSGPSNTDVVIDVSGYFAPGIGTGTTMPTSIVTGGWPTMFNGPGQPLFPPAPGVPPSTALACLPYQPAGYGIRYSPPGGLYYEPGAATPVATVGGSPFTLSYTVTASDTPATITSALGALIAGTSAIVSAGVTASVSGPVLTINVPSSLGVFGFVGNASSAGGGNNETETVSLTPGNVLTVSGTATAGDFVSMYLSFSGVTTAADQVWMCMLGASQTGEWVHFLTAP